MISWSKSAAQAKAAPKAAKRVLVIKFGELADFVQALAAAKVIRDYHVGARITLLTTEALKPLAEKCPYFDVVETEGVIATGTSAAEMVASAGGTIEPPKLVQIINRIRAGKYEMVYDLENSKRTINYYRGMRPWPPLWSGEASGASHRYNESGSANLHPLDRDVAQLAAAGVADGAPLTPDLSWVRSALRDPPRLKPDYFGIRGRYVLLMPRGTSPTPKRRWPEAKYVELAYRIASQGVTPVVLGGPDERDVGAAIARGEPKSKNLVARADLFQCAALAERAAFAVGDDVDLMHVAAAAGASCLVLLSSGDDPNRTAPRGRGGVVALTATVIADLPVEQVERQLRNCGVFLEARSA
jgi:ADP-heptose:LPS heptosyltransferase